MPILRKGNARRTVCRGAGLPVVEGKTARWAMGAPSIVLDGGLFHEDYASDSAYCLSCRVLITRPSEQAADKFQKKYNERMENLRERGEK